MIERQGDITTQDFKLILEIAKDLGYGRLEEFTVQEAEYLRKVYKRRKELLNE